MKKTKFGDRLCTAIFVVADRGELIVSEQRVAGCLNIAEYRGHISDSRNGDEKKRSDMIFIFVIFVSTLQILYL